MAIELGTLLKLRPITYHTTGRLNLEFIRDQRAVISTKSLLGRSEHASLLNGRRLTSTTILVNGRRVQIRDQLPLRPKSLLLQDGATLQDYIDELNQRVFFWAGTLNGPVSSGRRHLEHYSKEGEVFIIRTCLDSLLSANAGRDLFVTQCNSGTARHQNGQPVERGPETFCPLKGARFRASAVVELSFVDRADLPLDSEFSTSLAGPWQRLLV